LKTNTIYTSIILLVMSLEFQCC